MLNMSAKTIYMLCKIFNKKMLDGFLLHFIWEDKNDYHRIYLLPKAVKYQQPVKNAGDFSFFLNGKYMKGDLFDSV